MRTFLKALLGTLLGIILSLVVVIVALVVVVSSFAPSTSEPLQRGTVLEINLNESITDSPDYSPIGGLKSLFGASEQSTSLLSTIKALEVAASDPNITALSLRLDGGASLSLSTIWELREAINGFRRSCGKPIYAYSESYSQGAYYLASVADKIYIHPLGSVEWCGIATTSMYYGDLLRRSGITAEVFRPDNCTYKSAVEPYTADAMSAESREQSLRLVDGIWSMIISEVAVSRGIDEAELVAIARDEIFVESDPAVGYKMVDGVAYRDQYEEVLEKCGVVAEGGVMRRVTLSNYAYSVELRLSSIDVDSDNKIAVIYADGVIVDGDSPSASGEEVVSGVVVKQLRKAREDDDVRAVVLRVNSPGGSAMAADVMWREVKLLREVKPVIVSMGASAASGGYYISAPADYIIADPVCVTGSIGVFGLMFAYEKALNEHLHISIDGVKSSPSADIGRGGRELTPLQRKAIMRGVDGVYDAFCQRVAQGRSLSLDEVEQIAGGRIWSGEDAVEIGLVDQVGGFKSALNFAASRCGLGDEPFEFVEYSAYDSEWSAMMASLFGATAEVVTKLYSGSALDLERLFGRFISAKEGIIAHEPMRIVL